MSARDHAPSDDGGDAQERATESMVERVSRAIDADAWLAIDRGSIPAPLVASARTGLLGRARAAIEAMAEPTEAMILAENQFDEAWFDAHRRDDDAAIWRLMIQAALKEPT